MNIFLAITNFLFGLLNTCFVLGGNPKFMWMSLIGLIMSFWVSGWCMGLWFANR